MLQRVQTVTLDCGVRAPVSQKYDRFIRRARIVTRWARANIRHTALRHMNTGRRYVEWCWKRRTGSSSFRKALKAVQTAKVLIRSFATRVSVSALTGGDFAPPGWIGSATLHLAILATILVIWAGEHGATDVSPALVPIDLVSYADKTEFASLTRPGVKVMPLAQLPPVPLDKLDVQMPSLPDSDSNPGVDQATDDAPQPRQTALPISSALQQAAEPPVRTDVKPIGENPSAQIPTNPASVPGAPANARVMDRIVQGVGTQDAMTADIAALFRSQMQPCWSWPANDPRPERLAVDFDVFLNRDGSLSRPPQLVASLMAGAPHDPFLRAAAQAVRHAIYACAPYRMPADQYSLWREISPFHFDPGNLVIR